MRADNKKVTRLLKTARGQIDGILKMVEDNRYCMDIANQIMATQSVLGSANKEVIKGHMMGCIEDSFETGNQEEKLNELLALFEKLTK